MARSHPLCLDSTIYPDRQFPPTGRTSPHSHDRVAQLRWRVTPMSRIMNRMKATADPLPAELIELLERVQALPASVRSELEPIVDEALEQARFRGRVLSVARDALEQLRLDLELARFDLDATRRECEGFRRRL